MKYYAASIVLILFVITISYPTKVGAIRCFQCNSVNNSGCVTLQNYRRNLFHPLPCEDHNGEKAFCRTHIIQVTEKGKTYEPRVIRGCGYIAHKNPCYRVNNEGHSEEVCQCFEDGCNTAGLGLSFTGITYILIPTILTSLSTYILKSY